MAAYFSTLKIETVPSFETLVCLYLTARMYISEDVFHVCEHMFSSKRSNVGFEVLVQSTHKLDTYKYKMCKLDDWRALEIFNSQTCFLLRASNVGLSEGSAGGGVGVRVNLLCCDVGKPGTRACRKRDVTFRHRPLAILRTDGIRSHAKETRRLVSSSRQRNL
jgi:hypothetical protein